MLNHSTWQIAYYKYVNKQTINFYLQTGSSIHSKTFILHC